MEKLNPNINDNDVTIPDHLTDKQKKWFEAFVRWYRKNYSPKLDPKNIPNITAKTPTEAIFLNFLHFSDKYISERCTFHECEALKRHHPNSVTFTPGTDQEFHALANIFMCYGPRYFVDNTDVKGKTKQELEHLKTRPWIVKTTDYQTKTCTVTFGNPFPHHLTIQK